MILCQTKTFKHECCNTKAVLNEKNETEEEGNNKSDSNNEFISNDKCIVLISVHNFFLRDR